MYRVRTITIYGNGVVNIRSTGKAAKEATHES